MSDNKRIYYATKGLGVRKSGVGHGIRLVQRLDERYLGTIGGTAVSPPTVHFEPYGLGNPSASGIWEIPRGVQSVGITSTHNLEDVFQQGQLALYEQVEDRPEIEVTVSRVLDGTHPLYLMCSNDNADVVPSGAYNINARNDGYSVDLALCVYNDDVSHASGTGAPGAGAGFRPAVSRVLASGMFLSSFSYTFPVDGNATEECTFVGNDKYWDSDTSGGQAPLASFPDENLIFQDEDPSAYTTNFTTTGSTAGTGFTLTDGTVAGITRREDVYSNGNGPTGSFGGMVTTGAANPLVAVFPAEIPSNDSDCVQNITVSCDLGQEEILCLGSKSAATRYVTFPVEVTCSFECVTADGDLIEAHQTSTLAKQTIVIVTKQGLVLDLGSNNKLDSIDFSGGDTGGGNATVTYNYKNSNELTVRHARFV